MGIIDTMKFVPNDVCTYIIGQAASAGSLIACSGTKGKRFTLQHSNLMHQPLLMGVMEGQATDLEIEAREMLQSREALYGIYSKASGKTTDEIAATCDATHEPMRARCWNTASWTACSTACPSLVLTPDSVI